MPTLLLRIDCPSELEIEKIEKLKDAISCVDFDLVVFEHSYDEKNQINWDDYADSFNVLSG